MSPGWGVAIGGRHRAVWLDGEPGKPVGDLDLDGDWRPAAPVSVPKDIPASRRARTVGTRASAQLARPERMDWER